MNRLNRKLEYSLVALKHISRKNRGELTTAKEVVESYGTPFDATARVLQVMAQSGLLKSEQGAFGGYLLARDLSSVTLNDLIDIIQGPTQIAKCIGKEEICELHKNCNIVSPINQLNQKIIDFYKGLNLKELLH